MAASPDADLSVSLADELKATTAEQHRQAETRPVQQALAGGTIDRATYVHWLASMHLVHAALDRALVALDVAAGDDPAMATLLDGRADHVTRLAADLAVMSDDPSGAVRTTPGPAARGVAAAIEDLGRERPIALLGSLYVLEGSMNGNRFIARGLAKAWGSADGLAYLDPYRDEQRPRWMAWRAALDAAPLAPGDRAAIIAAAAAMFDGITDLSDEIAAA